MSCNRLTSSGKSSLFCRRISRTQYSPESPPYLHAHALQAKCAERSESTSSGCDPPRCQKRTSLVHQTECHGKTRIEIDDGCVSPRKSCGLIGAYADWFPTRAFSRLFPALPESAASQPEKSPAWYVITGKFVSACVNHLYPLHVGQSASLRL